MWMLASSPSNARFQYYTCISISCHCADSSLRNSTVRSDCCPFRWSWGHLAIGNTTCREIARNSLLQNKWKPEKGPGKNAVFHSKISWKRRKLFQIKTCNGVDSDQLAWSDVYLYWAYPPDLPAQAHSTDSHFVNCSGKVAWTHSYTRGCCVPTKQLFFFFWRYTIPLVKLSLIPSKDRQLASVHQNRD